MAVTRKIEDFEVVSADAQHWSEDIRVSVNDPEGGGFSVVYLTPAEAKRFAKELKAAIKELEGK